MPGFNFFLKKTKHQRFHIEPRYYDPIKEELKERTERIKRELDMDTEEREHFHSQIRGSFKRVSGKRDNSGFVRLMIIAFLVGGLMLYVYYGSVALYFLIVPFVVFYILIKFKLI